ncbi:ribosome biogenesis protein BMS1-like protein, partial [Euroglyphus maynei]
MDHQQENKKFKPNLKSKQKKKLSNDKKSNHKAFAIKSAVKAEKQFRRKQDIIAKREKLPQIDRTPLEPPPFVVSVVGPPKVGKTTLIRGLIRNYTRQNISQITGPITIVCNKNLRITLIECNNDINCMIDVAKISDLVLLVVDASFGFEMETFEFLNICQAHGFPRIMGVLTHLDVFKNPKKLRQTKKQLKHRFWTEIYSGAKLFYLSKMVHQEYLRNEIHNLARFISVIKFRPLEWNSAHPYVVVDRMEDLTNPDEIRAQPKCNRKVCLFGYSRGANFKSNQAVHIPGCGDFQIHSINFIPDPCPLPEKDSAQKKRRSLKEKDKCIYAPMAGVGGIVFDKDAIYIDLRGSHSMDQKDDKTMTEHEQLLAEIIYGKIDSMIVNGKDNQDSSNDISDGLFRQVQSDEIVNNSHSMKFTMNSLECSNFPEDLLIDFTINNAVELDSIRDCFITGQWNENEDAEAILTRDKLLRDELEQDDDESLYDDFEDLENDNNNNNNEMEMDKIDDDDLMDKKLMKKQQFNEEYDNLKSNN